MAVIDQINSYMPNQLSLTDPVYQAIFGETPFTPNSSITTSTDYQCGGVANEVEFALGFALYVTRSQYMANYQGDYLDRLVKFFTGLVRTYQEPDADLLKRFNALCQRRMNKSWLTTWMIRDVFSYFFNTSIIYVVENYVAVNTITDSGFEDGNLIWTTTQAGSTTVARTTGTGHQFQHGACIEFDIDAAGATGTLTQVLASPTNPGKYMLSFWVNDDHSLPANSDMTKVSLRRSGDSYYYNFDTWTWQSSPAYRIDKKTTEGRYEIRQMFVVLDGVYTLTLTIQNAGTTTVANKFYVDLVEFGPKMACPNFKVSLISMGSGVGFMNLWQGGNDPLPGTDYTFASFLDHCFIEGFGGVGTLAYYSGLLDIIRPAGVLGIIEVINRDA